MGGFGSQDVTALRERLFSASSTEKGTKKGTTDFLTSQAAEEIRKNPAKMLLGWVAERFNAPVLKRMFSQ
jgi:hypothetical protein